MTATHTPAYQQGLEAARSDAKRDWVCCNPYYRLADDNGQANYKAWNEGYAAASSPRMAEFIGYDAEGLAIYLGVSL
jgi:hypothetical protein